MSHFRGPRPRCDEAPCDVDDVADVSAHASGRSARQPPVLNLGSLPAKDAESWLARSSIDAEREPSLASRASTRPDSVAPLRELAVDLREQFPPQPTQCGHCYTWFPTRNALFRHLEGCKQKKPKWQAAQPKPRSPKAMSPRPRSPERSRAPSRGRVEGMGPVGVREPSLSMPRPRERSGTGSSDRARDKSRSGDEHEKRANSVSRPDNSKFKSHDTAVGCVDKRQNARPDDTQSFDARVKAYVHDVAGTPANDDFELFKERGEGPDSIRFARRAHFSLGRSSQAGMTLSSMVFSRFHMQLVHNKVDRHAYIIDLKSSNGTVVNGDRLESGVPHQLKLGDKVCIGTDEATRVCYVVSATFGKSTGPQGLQHAAQHKRKQMDEPVTETGESSDAVDAYPGRISRKAVQVAQDAMYAQALQRQAERSSSAGRTKVQVSGKSCTDRSARMDERKHERKSQFVSKAVPDAPTKGALCACKSGKLFAECHEPLLKKRQLVQAAKTSAVESSAKRAKTVTEVQVPKEAGPLADAFKSTTVEHGTMQHVQATKPDSIQARAKSDQVVTQVGAPKGAGLPAGARKSAAVEQGGIKMELEGAMAPPVDQSGLPAMKAQSESTVALHLERENVEKTILLHAASGPQEASKESEARAVAVPAPNKLKKADEQVEGSDSSRDPSDKVQVAESSAVDAPSDAESNRGNVKMEAEIGEDLIGWRVNVYWPGEAQWFSGYVIDVFVGRKKASAKRGSIKVLYDDGDIQDERMKDIRWVDKVEEPQGDAVVGWRVKCLRESENAWVPAIVTDSISEEDVQVMFQDGVPHTEAREDILWISAPVRIGSRTKNTIKASSSAQSSTSCSTTVAAPPVPISTPSRAPSCPPVCHIEHESPIAMPGSSMILPPNEPTKGAPAIATKVVGAHHKSDDDMLEIPTQELKADAPPLPTEQAIESDMSSKKASASVKAQEDVKDLSEEMMMDNGEVERSRVKHQQTIEMAQKRKIDQGAVSDAVNAKARKSEASFLQDKCWECKFGEFARRKNGRNQCRSTPGQGTKGAMGHTACDWQDDPRHTGQVKPQHSAACEVPTVAESELDLFEKMETPPLPGGTSVSECSAFQLTAVAQNTDEVVPRKQQFDDSSSDESWECQASPNEQVQGFPGSPSDFLQERGGDGLVRDELDAMLEDVGGDYMEGKNGGAANNGEGSSALLSPSIFAQGTPCKSGVILDDVYHGIPEMEETAECLTQSHDAAIVLDSARQMVQGGMGAGNEAASPALVPAANHNLESSNLMGRLEWLMGESL